MRRALDLRAPSLPGGVSAAHWLAFAVLWALAMGLIVLVRYPEVIAGAQLDADGYMRLVRVERLARDWAWFDNVIPRSNWPFSDVLHWSRPLDVLILLLAAPLIPFLGMDAGIQIAGTIVSPILHLASCLAVIWVAAPLASLRVRALAAPALLVQPVALSYGLPGRADHHALITFLFVLALGLALRWLSEPTRQRAALATGLVCAGGLWVSPEFLVPIALFLAGGSAMWLLRGPPTVGGNLAFAGGLAAGVAAALLLERPPSDWLRVEYDRISVAYLTMAVLASGFWLAVAGAGRPAASAGWRAAPTGHRSASAGRRAAVALAGAALTATLLHLIHPGFFQGPWSAAAPETRLIWLQHVNELQPAGITSLESLGRGIATLGLSVFVLPFVAWRGWASWRAGAREEVDALGTERATERASWRSGAREEGLRWGFLALATLGLAALTWHQARWGTYVGVLLAVGVVALLDHLLPVIDARFEGMRRRALRLGAIVTLMPGILFVGYAVSGLLAQEEVEGVASSAEEEAASRGGEEPASVADDQAATHAEEEPECRTDRVAALLRDPAFAGGREVTVLTHVDRGPEILYRTGHRVLAGPYHRNLRGIEDIHRAFTLPPDDPVVHRILRERDVAIVLLCPSMDRGFLGRGEEGSTFHRLVDGPLPEWAVELEMPPEPRTGFRAFRVVAVDGGSDADGPDPETRESGGPDPRETGGVDGPGSPGRTAPAPTRPSVRPVRRQVSGAGAQQRETPGPTRLRSLRRRWSHPVRRKALRDQRLSEGHDPITGAACNVHG